MPYVKKMPQMPYVKKRPVQERAQARTMPEPPMFCRKPRGGGVPTRYFGILKALSRLTQQPNKPMTDHQ